MEGHSGNATNGGGGVNDGGSSRIEGGENLTPQVMGGFGNDGFGSDVSAIRNVQMEIEVPNTSSNNEQAEVVGAVQFVPPQGGNAGYQATPNFYYPSASGGGGVPAGPQHVGNQEVVFYPYNNQYNGFMSPSAVVPVPPAAIPYNHNVYSNRPAPPAYRFPGNNGEYIYVFPHNPHGYQPNYGMNLGSQQPVPVARPQMVREGRSDLGRAAGGGGGVMMNSVERRSYTYSGFQEFIPPNAAAGGGNVTCFNGTQPQNQPAMEIAGNQISAQTSWITTNNSGPTQDPVYVQMNANLKPGSDIPEVRGISPEQGSVVVQPEDPVPPQQPAVVSIRKGPSSRKKVHAALGESETSLSIEEENKGPGKSQRMKKKNQKKTPKEDATPPGNAQQSTRKGKTPSKPSSTLTDTVLAEVYQQINAKLGTGKNAPTAGLSSNASSLSMQGNNSNSISIPKSVKGKQVPKLSIEAATAIISARQYVAPVKKLSQRQQIQAQIIPTPPPKDVISNSENEENETGNSYRKCVVCCRQQQYTEDIYEVGHAMNGQGPHLLKTIGTLISHLQPKLNLTLNGKPTEEGICSSCLDNLQQWHVFRCSVVKQHSEKSLSQQHGGSTLFPDNSFQVNVYRHPDKLAQMKAVLGETPHVYLAKRRISDKDLDYLCDAIVRGEGLKTMEKLIMSWEKLSHLYCSSCKRLVNDGRNGFLEHFRTSHPNELVTFPCDICGDQFPEEGYFSHWIKHFYLSTCTECREMFPSQPKLVEHCSTAHRRPETERMPSSENAEGGSAANGNIRVPTGEDDLETRRPFKCELCNARYMKRHQLKVHHDSIHLNLLKHVCRVCGNRYKSWGSLRRHRLATKHENPPSLTFKCEVCNKELRTKTGYLSHSRTHKNETGNGMVTDENGNQVNHPKPRSSHSKSDDVKFVCKTCGKMYKTKGPFDSHVCRDLLQCSLCDFETRIKYEFIQHMSNHKRKSTPKRTCDQGELPRRLTRSKSASASSQGVVESKREGGEKTSEDNTEENRPGPEKKTKKRTTSENSNNNHSRKKRSEPEVESNPSIMFNAPQSPKASVPSASTDMADPVDIDFLEDMSLSLTPTMQSSNDSVNVSLEMHPNFAQPEQLSTLRDRLLASLSESDPNANSVDEYFNCTDQ